MTKQWQIILIALGILIVLYVINNYNQQKLSTSTDSIFPLEKDEVSSFVISKGSESLELVKEDTLWFIVGHDSLIVKDATMNTFFNRSLTVKRESMISRNPEKWSTYSVDDSTGTLLQIFDQNGTKIGSAVFGQSKSEWSKNFVRMSNKKEVFQTDNSILYQLQTRPTYWGEKPKPPEPDSTSVN